jgi:hypothetical protein
MKYETKTLGQRIKDLLEPLADDLISIHYNLLFSRNPSNGYKKILNNAWKKAKKIVNLPSLSYLKPNVSVDINKIKASKLYDLCREFVN